MVGEISFETAIKVSISTVSLRVVRPEIQILYKNLNSNSPSSNRDFSLTSMQ